MKADTLQLLGDFIGSNKVLFRIPVYQRNYDWSEENCIRLLDDIRDIIDTDEKHFLGTIVYMAIENHSVVLHDYIIIDGQQRLTTTMIILKALYDFAKDQGNNIVMSDINDYLQNRNCTEEYKIKLKSIETDNEQFLALLNNSKMNKEGHIYKNYEICRKYINSWLNAGISLNQILKALTKLEIVGIALKQNEDDPQIIFESLNSTGLELSNADLVRNFLLMNAPEQNRLFKEYWLEIERELRKNTDYSNLNLFFSSYVVFKLNRPINEKYLYQSFVKLFKTENFTHEDCLKELKNFADIFKNFISPENTGYSQKIKRCLQSLKTLKQTTCFPFLLHVFYDYEEGVIDQDTLEKTLHFILVYLFRRSVCGIPTNSLRGLFAYLYARVFRVSENKSKYYESINKFLSTVFSGDIIPSETACYNALINGNLYKKSALCRFIMMEIENGDSKEVLKDDKTLTIEHIMPQVLTVEWQKSFSEKDHETYLHTLGNLTVTGYNSELSNKSFKEKKDIIGEKSRAIVLNRDVLDKDSWTVENIKERSERLAKTVLDRYKVEKIDDSSITFEYTSKITLNEISKVTYKKLVSFTLKEKIYRQNVYAQMLIDVVNLLDKENPNKLEELADNSFFFRKSAKGYVSISRNREKLRKPQCIRDNIFIETNLSASAILSFIKALLKEYEIDESLFYISVISEKSE